MHTRFAIKQQRVLGDQTSLKACPYLSLDASRTPIYYSTAINNTRVDTSIVFAPPREPWLRATSRGGALTAR